MWIRRPSSSHCAQVGEAAAKLHLAGADFAKKRPNALSVDSWRPLYEQAKSGADKVHPGLAKTVAAELDRLEKSWPRDLPQGVIHADLFPDNVFFLGNRLSGLIDFYFACTDTLAYDVAICLNAWCFEPDLSFNATKARALLQGYERVRPLEAAERAAMPMLARGAALRFLMTRLYDWVHTPKDALVKRKDPREYLAKLRFDAQQLATLRALGEYRGKQQLYVAQSPAVLSDLRQVAVVESTESSNRLEGVVVAAHRLKSLVLKNATPKSRSEQEVAGYRDALGLIHESGEPMPFSEGTVLQLVGALQFQHQLLALLHVSREGRILGRGIEVGEVGLCFGLAVLRGLQIPFRGFFRVFVDSALAGGIDVADVQLRFGEILVARLPPPGQGFLHILLRHSRSESDELDHVACRSRRNRDRDRRCGCFRQSLNARQLVA